MYRELRRARRHHMLMRMEVTCGTPMYVCDRGTWRSSLACYVVRVMTHARVSRIGKRPVPDTVQPRESIACTLRSPAMTGRALIGDIMIRLKARAYAQPDLEKTSLLVAVRIEGTSELAFGELHVDPIPLLALIDRRDASGRHIAEARDAQQVEQPDRRLSLEVVNATIPEHGEIVVRRVVDGRERRSELDDFLPRVVGHAQGPSARAMAAAQHADIDRAEIQLRENRIIATAFR